MAKARGICGHAYVIPDRAGRVTMRADKVYPCRAPVPEPVFPVSITKAYGYTWPPQRTYIRKEDCAGCPCWTPREAKP